MIQLNTVAKHYSEAVHIGPVSLELPRGGITALVGPNGAGKSTLLTMIGRLLGIDEGTITVGGADVSTTKSKDLAKILSILRQENHFVSRLTVRQLVAFGRFLTAMGISTPRMKTSLLATSISWDLIQSKRVISTSSLADSANAPTLRWFYARKRTTSFLMSRSIIWILHAVLK